MPRHKQTDSKAHQMITFLTRSLFPGIILYSFMTFILVIPVSAAQLRYNSESQLSELTQRFNSLDANWGRFQLNGGLTLEAATALNHFSGNWSVPDFSQQLSLNLDAYIDRNLQFSFRLSHQGGWGFSNQWQETSNAPQMTSSPQVDEAFLKLEQSNTLDYLGRFRFTLGPLGLISDFAVNPAEGLVLQYRWGDYSLTGLYSRVATVYAINTTDIASSDDYLATRLSWSKNNLILGLNLVPNGMTGEKSFSLDAAGNFRYYRFVSELGWYAFQSADPVLQVDWTPGLMIGFGFSPSAQSDWLLKLGYFGFNFRPSYSSLAHCSGDDREWFPPNSQGLEINQHQILSKSIHWENRLALWWPVQVNSDQFLSYHWLSSIVKDFSPVNQLECGIDLKSYPNFLRQQLLIKWNLRF